MPLPESTLAQITNDFWNRHGIADTVGRSLAEPAIIALETAHEILRTAFDTAPEPVETSGFFIQAFTNLSDRIYEQAAGMLVCLGTGSAAAAETLARTVMEGALNSLYMTSQDHQCRLFAYFYQHIHEHDRKLDEWRKMEAESNDPVLNEDMLGIIASQKSTHAKMAGFVDDLAAQFGMNASEILKHWPKSLYKRCEQIDRAGHYLTAYHRLSASSHINAEETLRWLFGFYVVATTKDRDYHRRLSVETVSFSTMMTRFAVLYYIESGVAMCRALDAKLNESAVKEICATLLRSTDEIAPAAGCA